MRKKFKIFYSSDNPDPEKAGKKYKPAGRSLVVMSNDGIFFLAKYYEYEGFGITPLHEVIGNYDVVWNE